MQDVDYVIVRETERQRITGVTRGGWARLEQEDKAPKRIPLTDDGITIGWLKPELLAWIQERAAQRSGASENDTEGQIAKVEAKDSNRDTHRSTTGGEDQAEAAA